MPSESVIRSASGCPSLLPPPSTMSTNTGPLDADQDVILQVRLTRASSPTPTVLTTHLSSGTGCSRKFLLRHKLDPYSWFRGGRNPLQDRFYRFGSDDYHARNYLRTPTRFRRVGGGCPG